MDDIRFISAWEAHTGNVCEILSEHPADADVWTAPDGSMAVGDLWNEETDVEYTHAGTVAEYLADADFYAGGE